MTRSATASRSRYNLCDRVHGCFAFASQGIVIRSIASSGQRCLCCWSLRRKHQALTYNCRCQRYWHRFTASIMRMIRPCMHPHHAHRLTVSVEHGGVHASMPVSGPSTCDGCLMAIPSRHCDSSADPIRLFDTDSYIGSYESYKACAARAEIVFTR